MTILTYDDIMQLDRRYRANLINTASGPRSACLVGTTDRSGQHNLAIFNTVTHIGANPPYLGLIMRPHTVERHTLENIKATGKYTISHVASGWVEQAHQTSGKYDRATSEFEATGLEPKIDPDGIPYVEQSVVSMSLELKEVVPITTNDTLLIVGQVQELRLTDCLIKENGAIDLEKAQSVAVGGLYDYYDLRQRYCGHYVSVSPTNPS